MHPMHFLLYGFAFQGANEGSFQCADGILLIAGAALTLLIKPQPKSDAAAPEPATAK